MHPFGNNVVQRVFIDNGEIHRVGKSNRRSSTPFGAVAGRAVLCVESTEVHNLIRRHWHRIFLRLTMWGAATREQHKSEDDERRQIRDPAHRRSSPLFPGVPGASIPARRTNDTFSRVGMLSWRTTTRPATTP